MILKLITVIMSLYGVYLADNGIYNYPLLIVTLALTTYIFIKELCYEY